MSNNQQLLKDLAKAKAMFQMRSILAVMEVPPEEVQCGVCGDHHEPGEVPFTCETGDGE